MRQRLNVDAEMVGNRLGGFVKIAPVYRTLQSREVACCAAEALKKVIDHPGLGQIATLFGKLGYVMRYRLDGDDIRLCLYCGLPVKNNINCYLLLF